MTCKNCGAVNPESACFCGNCGTPLNKEIPTNDLDATVAANPPAENEVVTETVVTNETENKTATVSEAENTAAPAIEPEVAIPTENAAFNEEQYFEEPKKKKNKAAKILLPIIIVLVVFAILATAAICYWPYITNTAMRVFSPEKHQAWVYKNAAASLSEKYTDPMKDGESNKGNVTLNLSDEALELIEEFTDEVDFAQINDITVNYEYSIKNGNQALVAGIKHPDMALNAEVYTNAKDEEITVLLPEFNDEALLVEADDYDIPLTPVAQVMPSKELVEKTLSKYAYTLFANAEDVTRGKATYTVDGKDVESLCFETKVSSELAAKALLAVLEEAKDDKELREYCDEVLLPFLDYSSDDFDEIIDDAIESLEDVDTDDDVAFTLYTYINNKGEITAIEIFTEGDEEIQIICGSYTKGKNVSYEISVISDYRGEAVKEMSFVVTGTEVRNKLNATAVLTVEDEEMLEVEIIDFNTKTYKSGCPKGKLKISGSILAEITGESMLENLAIEIEFDVKSSSYSYAFKVLSNDTEYACINIKGKTKNAKNIKLHTDTNEDIEDWASDLDEDVLEDIVDIFVN